VCWGADDIGQLGDGMMTTLHALPTPVMGLPDAMLITAGATHTCTLRSTTLGFVCWGSNMSGELGDSSTSMSLVPTVVGGLSGGTSISAGASFTCAVAGGAASCWGTGGAGQLGNEMYPATPTPMPVPVTGLTDPVQVSSGVAHACALLVSGAVMCWGDNGSSRLGNQTLTATSSNIPVMVSF
jgi:alpha-tubulin suppressor-like RCC1 family protein